MSKKLAVQCQCLRKAVQDLSRETIDNSDSIIDVERIFLSECNLVKKCSSSTLLRKSASEPDIHYHVDYDDLCRPSWPLPEHPALKRYDDDVALKPMLCTWKFITHQDIQCMRQHLFDEIAIKSIIERQLPDCLVFEGKGEEVFLSFAWKMFKYMRENNFSGKGISSALGLFYFTHRYFLSNPWRTARETFSFFEDGVKLHAFLKPPESDMIFNVSECDKLLDMFWSLYIQNLELVRSVCIPKYNLILDVKKCGIQNYKTSLASKNSETQM